MHLFVVSDILTIMTQRKTRAIPSPGVILCSPSHSLATDPPAGDRVWVLVKS